MISVGKIFNVSFKRYRAVHVTVKSDEIDLRFASAVLLLICIDKAVEPFLGLIPVTIVNCIIGEVERRLDQFKIVVGSYAFEHGPQFSCLSGGHVGLALEVGLIESKKVFCARILFERITKGCF